MTDKCFICDHDMVSFFTKNFQGSFGLNEVNYVKCTACGFVVSRTHRDMSLEKWERLNSDAHSTYQGTDFVKEDPKWLDRLGKQRDVINCLHSEGVLPSSRRWIDYACGDGKLVDMLRMKSLTVEKYDQYMSGNDGSYLGENGLIPEAFDLVINTSFMEHVLSIEPLDRMASLVSPDGVLAIHTLVRENVPCDPGWFYLLPVHVSFFTNKAMSILFDRWGFKCSIYHLPSTMWFFFKKESPALLDLMQNPDHCGKQGPFFFKRGFVDYWK